jgi:hypothetical protein
VVREEATAASKISRGELRKKRGVEKTMKDLGLLVMKCDCEKKLSSTKISEARCVSISLSDWQ